MDLTILKVFRSIYFRTEAEVALIVHPSFQWFEICPKDPLSDIEFLLFDNEGPLYVFLSDP
jgi:hypothetical protein